MPGAGSPDRLCLVDGSGILFRAFHALPPLTTRQGLPTGAVYGFTTMLTKLVREQSLHRIAVVLDAPGKTFRDEAYAAYKATRAPTPSDLARQIPYVKRIIEALGFPLLMISGVEADDVIGTLAARAVRAGHDVDVVTSDKDMMQLVGPQVRLIDTMNDRVTGMAEVRERFGVEPAQVVEVMGLMGDSIDNIPGVKGIGEKTAKQLISHFGSIEQLYARLGELGGLGLRGAARIRAQLEAGREEAQASRSLATIHCDLPLELELDSLQRKPPDIARLGELARELEFSKLLAELLGGSAEDQPRREIRATSTAETDQALDREARVAVAIAGETAPAGSDRGTSIAFAFVGREEILVTDQISDGLRGVLTGRSPVACLVLEDWKALLHTAREDGEPGAEPDPNPGAICDVQLVSYVLDPSRRGHSIDAQSTDRLGRTLAGGEDPVARAASVAGALAELAPSLMAELEGAGLAALYRDLELPLARVLARIERRGIAVDRRVLEGAGEDFRQAAAALEGEIHALAGGPFNIQSPIQLREVLFDRLKLPTRGVRKGKTGLSVNAEVLGQLAEEHPIAEKVIEHRALMKLLSTYVTGLLPLIDVESGRLHTSFNQAVAATGRLSSSEPNLQNIPVRTAEGRRIRAAFVAPRDHVLLAGDYSQIELRVLAHLTQDPVLLGAFRSGEDIHRRTAAEVFGVGPEEITSEMRQKAKVINFGILYGMGAQRLSREVGVPFAEAERYIRRYFERYAYVRAFADRVVGEGREQGFVSTLIGRRRYLPELNAREPNLRQAAERMAWNSPIQGTAADIIKLAMLAVEKRLSERGGTARMVLQVHDELLFELPASELAATRDLVQHCMESVISLDVPLVVDMKSGPNWASLQ